LSAAVTTLPQRDRRRVVRNRRGRGFLSERGSRDGLFQRREFRLQSDVALDEAIAVRAVLPSERPQHVETFADGVDASAHGIEGVAQASGFATEVGRFDPERFETFRKRSDAWIEARMPRDGTRGLRETRGGGALAFGHRVGGGGERADEVLRFRQQFPLGRKSIRLTRGRGRLVEFLDRIAQLFDARETRFRLGIRRIGVDEKAPPTFEVLRTRGDVRFDARKAVEHAALGVGAQEAQLIPLAMHVAEETADGLEDVKRAKVAVDPSTRAAVGADHAPHDQFAAAFDQFGHFTEARRRTVVEAESSFDGAFRGTGADEFAVGAFSEQKIEGFENERFALARFTAQDVESRTEVHRGVFDQREVADAKLFEHGTRFRKRGRPSGWRRRRREGSRGFRDHAPRATCLRFRCRAAERA
jgi:hypothetical protein